MSPNILVLVLFSVQYIYITTIDKSCVISANSVLKHLEKTYNSFFYCFISICHNLINRLCYLGVLLLLSCRKNNRFLKCHNLKFLLKQYLDKYNYSRHNFYLAHRSLIQYSAVTHI